MTTRAPRCAALAITAAIGLVVFAGSAAAQIPRPPASAGGAELFATTCQVCHGQAGIGGVGPALRGAKFTADYVRKVLQDGRPGTMMPGFASTMSAAEIADIARYVVRLQAPDGPAPAGLRGDPTPARRSSS